MRGRILHRGRTVSLILLLAGALSGEVFAEHRLNTGKANDSQGATTHQPTLEDQITGALDNSSLSQEDKNALRDGLQNGIANMTDPKAIEALQRLLATPEGAAIDPEGRLTNAVVTSLTTGAQTASSPMGRPTSTATTIPTDTTTATPGLSDKAQSGLDSFKAMVDTMDLTMPTAPEFTVPTFKDSAVANPPDPAIADAAGAAKQTGAWAAPPAINFKMPSNDDSGPGLYGATSNPSTTPSPIRKGTADINGMLNFADNFR